MISEFQDLSLKIDQLADLTAALRRENASLRQTNVELAAENANHRQRLAEARQRIGALIAQIPVPALAAPAAAPVSVDAEVAK
jgi:cell division protein ZapB